MENNKFISLVDSSVKPHVDYTNKPARQDNENALFSLGDSIKSNYELTNNYISTADDYTRFSRYNDENKDINKVLNDMSFFDSMKEVNNDILESIDTNSEYVRDKIIYSKNQDKNQKLMTDAIVEEKNSIQEKNKSALNGLNLQKKNILINNYQHKKYMTQNSILFFIVKICAAVIVLTLLNNKFSRFFPDIIYSTLVGIIFAYAMITIVYRLYDIYLRDRHDFDEYDLGVMPSSEDTEYNVDVDETKSVKANCVSATS